MLSPETIIELDYQFDNDQIDELKKFLEKYYDIYDHDVAIYKSENYAKESYFAQSVFDDILKEKALENDLLKPILRPIEQIESQFKSVEAVSRIYDDVYKNIIRPIQKEGEAGVKQTVKWAIISIVASTLLSVLIGNWESLYKLIVN